MLIDQHTRDVLEFNRVLDLLADGAITGPGAEWIRGLAPRARRQEAEAVRDAVGECIRLSEDGRPLRVDGFVDLTSIVHKLRPRGAVLSPREFLHVRDLLRAARAAKRRIADYGSPPKLTALTTTVRDIPELRSALERCLEDDGTVSDGATTRLAGRRNSLRSIERRIEEILGRILRDSGTASVLQDRYITRRNDRWVIPVKRSVQGTLGGVVHDVSQSGETAFVEPLETLPLGNDLVRLHAEERNEVRSILLDLSDRVRDQREILTDVLAGMARLDGISSVAEFAVRHTWRPCPFGRDNRLRIRNGRHPLLEHRLGEGGGGDVLVPLILELDTETMGLVISGSNTGGKTVILKTVGILVLLAQSGLPLPADDGTELPWLSFLGAVIGDEQSIEDDLSTFSGRLMRVVRILRDAAPGGLALIDELGSGTDPDEGSALTTAVLESLVDRGTRVLATTHLDQVKAFAHEREGFINAAVAFDPVDFRPTYRLVLGEPGSSHALQIGRRVGVPDDVIENASRRLGTARADLEGLVRDLNTLRRETRHNREAAERERRAAADLKQDYEKRMAAIDGRRKEILREAYREAEKIVAETRREIRRELDALRRRDDRTAEKALRKEAKAMAEKESALRRAREALEPPPEQPLAPEEIRPGALVRIAPTQAHGTIESIDPATNTCRITVGAVSVTAKTRDIYPPAVSETAAGAGRRMPVRAGEYGSRDSLRPGAPVRREINLVGSRVGPAESRLERFFDDAALTGLSTVRVIHGIGTGTLARAVRDFAANHPAVGSWRPGEPDEGGDGVTIVDLA